MNLVQERKIKIFVADGIVFVSPIEIVAIKSENRKTKIFLITGSVIDNFKDFKSTIDLVPNYFIQIHRSYYINMMHFSVYNPTLNQLKTKQSFFFPVGRVFKKDVESYLLNTELLLSKNIGS